MVPIVVQIPLKNLVLVPLGGNHEGRIKLFLAARDTEGRVAPVQEVPVRIQIPSDEIERALERLYNYRINMRMRSGSHRVAVGVRDEIGATDCFVTGRVTVGGG